MRISSKVDSFVFAVVVIIVVAYFFPKLGQSESNFPLETISNVGISLIFFFYGLKLSPEKFKAGILNWKLHLLVQFSTFLLFPLIILAFYPLVRNENGQILWIAFLFLAALPSTVSSSVVMVSIARGNLPAAIFNASISGLIGIIVTPLWIDLFLTDTVNNSELANIYLKLIIKILVPVIIGISLQKYLGKFATKNIRYLNLFDKSIILLIVYKSFAESFEDKVFKSLGIEYIIIVTSATIALFFLVYILIGYFSCILKFNLKDKITAQFCGTKKSLMHGTVFSKILIPESVSLGIVLLPLMLFHAIQILIISFIATRLAKRFER
ncbi:MAG: bile acid:sodium symporter [Bacteroidales bacterium]|nr:bile acid:sodium symporter [Bacteroidales bacterium]